MNLSGLPEEVLHLILKELDYSDLCSLSQVAVTYRDCVYNADLVWRTQCAKWWLDDKKTKCTSSWRDNFLAWFKDMGRYIHCYATIRQYWDRIEEALRKRCPAVLETLGDPVLEKDFGVDFENLPLDMKCSYRIHNGQCLTSYRHEETMKGLLGYLQVYGHQISEVLLPLDEIKYSPHVEIGAFERSDPKSMNITQRYVYFEYDRNEYKKGYQLSVCVQDYKELRRGNIFIQARGRSLNETGACVLIADTFTSFLQNLADLLEGPYLQLESERILLFRHNPECVAITRNVKVTVATSLVPEFSIIMNQRPKKRLMYAYRITMSMDEDCPPNSTCTLRRRHWEIVEDVSKPDRVETVDGDAVIGLYPTVSPGSVFSYVSWTPMQFEEGFMQGHFTFYNHSTGEEFNVQCPRFYLRSHILNETRTAENDNPSYIPLGTADLFSFNEF